MSFRLPCRGKASLPLGIPSAFVYAAEAVKPTFKLVLYCTSLTPITNILLPVAKPQVNGSKFLMTPRLSLYFWVKHPHQVSIMDNAFNCKNNGKHSASPDPTQHQQTVVMYQDTSEVSLDLKNRSRGRHDRKSLAPSLYWVKLQFESE